MSEFGPREVEPGDAPVLVEIEQIDQGLAALAWQNFLKTLSQGISEFDAREALLRRLELESSEIAKKRPRVDAATIPLLDSDVGRSVLELQAYLAGELRPQNSYLVRTPWTGLNNQRVPEVANLRWKPSTELRYIEGMNELNTLESENVKLYYELMELINRGLSDEDKRDRLEECKDQMDETVVAVRNGHLISKADPDQFVKVCAVLRAANSRLAQIKTNVEKIVQERL